MKSVVARQRPDPPDAGFPLGLAHQGLGRINRLVRNDRGPANCQDTQAGTVGGIKVAQRQSRGFRQVPPVNHQDHPVLERPGDGSIGQGRAIDQVDVLNRGLVVAQGFLGTGLGQQSGRLEAVRSANPLDIGRVALSGCGGGNPSRVQPGLNLWNRGAVLGQALLSERLVALKHQRSQAQRPLLIVISPVDDRTGHGPRPGSDAAMQVSVEFQLERFPHTGQERII